MVHPIFLFLNVPKTTVGTLPVRQRGRHGGALRHGQIRTRVLLQVVPDEVPMGIELTDAVVPPVVPGGLQYE